MDKAKEDNLMDTNDVEEILDIDSSDEAETETETEIENDIENEIENKNICKNQRKKIINTLQNDYKSNKNLSKQDQENEKLLFNRLKNLYHSCIDVDTISKKGVKPMIDLLKKITNL
ncbi:hypothetical protein H8356DRAFT_1084328 [Neocallimastix lanati (nom. inval.)]|nr:hypothetical protein H8356DRAFT_1084328 [Neocallimastix sp. JGI-2020a]